MLNLLALPLYLVPMLNLPIWLALNGYLVAREYVELVALRRLPPAQVASLRRDHRLAFWTAGMVIALLLAVPVLNLIAPDRRRRLPDPAVSTLWPRSHKRIARSKILSNHLMGVSGSV